MSAPPPQLKEFIKNAGVRVQRDENLGNFAEFVNYENVVTPNIVPTPLRYTNFIAEVPYVTRPADVVKYVRNTKPLRVDGPYDVQEITGYYGQFQKGVTHTNLYGFQVHQDLNANTLKNKAWSFIEFRVIVDKRHVIIARVYQDKMMLQGSMVGDPLELATYLVSKYLKLNVELFINYKKLDASFRFNGEFNPRAVSQRLTMNSVDHSYEPELFPNEIKNIKYKGIVIDSIVSTGYVRLHNARSKQEMENMYRVAKQFLVRLENKKVLTPKNAPPPEVQRKIIPPPTKVRAPRVEKLRNETNVLLNGEMCAKYKTETLKDICRAMGIFGKKDWKKKDYCRAIFDKTFNNVMEGTKSVNRTNRNTLYKQRGINDDSIRKMLKNANSKNVNANLKRVKNTMYKVKSDKKGVPFKKGVQNAVKRITKEQRMVDHAKSVLKRYNALTNTTQTKILQRVKNLTSVRAVNAAVKRNVEISRLNASSVVKNKIYEDLKNKKNVNVKQYARLYKLAQNNKSVLNWLKSRNTLPTNENVMKRLKNTRK